MKSRSSSSDSWKTIQRTPSASSVVAKTERKSDDSVHGVPLRDPEQSNVIRVPLGRLVGVSQVALRRLVLLPPRGCGPRVGVVAVKDVGDLHEALVGINRLDVLDHRHAQEGTT